MENTVIKAKAEVKEKVWDLPVQGLKYPHPTAREFLGPNWSKDGQLISLTINASGGPVHRIETPQSAYRYAMAALDLVLRYKWLREGKHLSVTFSQGMGFIPQAGVARFADGNWYQVNILKGGQFQPTSAIVFDTPEQKRLSAHEAMDTILTMEVVIDSGDFAGDEMSQVLGTLRTVNMIFNAPDIPTAQKVRQAIIDKSREGLAEYRIATNIAKAPGYKPPTVLVVEVDGDVTNLIDDHSYNGQRLFEVDPETGEELGKGIYWDHSTGAKAQVNGVILRGNKLKTKK